MAMEIVERKVVFLLLENRGPRLRGYKVIDVHDMNVNNDLSDYHVVNWANCSLELNQEMRKLLTERKPYKNQGW
jgi:hypothetical protein